jgi:hypothetical protein
MRIKGRRPSPGTFPLGIAALVTRWRRDPLLDEIVLECPMRAILPDTALFYAKVRKIDVVLDPVDLYLTEVNTMLSG